MARGDHIFVERPWRYTHHGIDVGDGTVIHFSGEPGGSKMTACVCRCSMDEFIDGGQLQVRVYARRVDRDEAVARAESRLGECGYNVVNNNCEHFARWCVTDKHASAQVNGVFAVGGVSAATATAASGGIGLVGAVGAAAGVSGPGIMSGLATVGGVVGGGAVAGLAVIGAAPAAASALIMNVALKDDDTLPDDERDARKIGRRASVVGGAAGTAAGLTAVSSLGVAGLSGAGITSGLATVGSLFGGGMAAGTMAVAAAPVAAAAGLGFVAYKLGQRIARSKQPPIDPLAPSAVSPV
ncbi:MAG TPA: lecithin retinol acyltransferase family protein [Mycobacteriales bacterium]|nr:lecithin retinol acyltransferase family protein [Mycobacteriales bacterium]